MKKFLFLFIAALSLTACDVDDDGPGTVQVLAEVTDADLPEFFEKDKLYDIKITYLLPDACHTGIGVQAMREGSGEAERRKIYVGGVASRPANQTTCNLEEDDLEVEGSFSMRVDSDQPYTFYLWTGVDVDGESVYDEVVVPVGEEEPATPQE
jgi:hypothetical protein